MDNNDTAQKLQAILYANGGEMKKSQVIGFLDISKEELVQALSALQTSLQGQGVELLETESSLSLRTASRYGDFLTELRKKDNEKDIGTAGLEVLAIVLYKGEVSRATIDYIRGVNSSGTLRQLMLRGLLERTKDAGDARAWVYSATPELLGHLGITTRQELPEFDILSTQLQENNNEQKTYE